VAVAAGLFGQGAYYTPVQRYVGVFIAAGTVLALAAWPPTHSDARLVPVVPALTLAAWAGLDAALHGESGYELGIVGSKESAEMTAARAETATAPAPVLASSASG